MLGIIKIQCADMESIFVFFNGFSIENNSHLFIGSQQQLQPTAS